MHVIDPQISDRKKNQFWWKINFENFTASHENKFVVLAVFEPGTSGTVDQSYNRCANKETVGTIIWRYKVFHNESRDVKNP